MLGCEIECCIRDRGVQADHGLLGMAGLTSVYGYR